MPICANKLTKKKKKIDMIGSSVKLGLKILLKILIPLLCKLLLCWLNYDLF